MFKGTVILVAFPFTDLSGNKVRPCIVLHDQKSGEDCIVAFISSVPHTTPPPYGVRVQATAANGLKTNSVIKTNKIATLQKKIILGELGKLDKIVMQSVDAQLKKVFSL